MFPQKRVQQFKPAAGTVTQKKIQRQIDTFVESCFEADGTKKADGNYPAVAGKGDKNCKYCFAKNREDLCPKANRIRQ